MHVYRPMEEGEAKKVAYILSLVFFFQQIYFRYFSVYGCLMCVCIYITLQLIHSWKDKLIIQTTCLVIKFINYFKLNK